MATEQNTARPRTPFTLFVESGLHQGTVQALTPGAYRVGRELTADIVLADDGVLDHHVLFDLDRRMARIEPLAGAVVVDGRPLAPGEFLSISLPGTIEIGGARLSLRAPKDRSRPCWRRRALLAASVVVACLLPLHLALSPSAGMMTMSVWGASSPSTSPVPSLSLARLTTDAGTPGTPPAPRAAETASIAGSPEAVPEPADPRAELRRHLADQGLDRLDIGGEGGRITVDGVLAPDALERWQSVQMWFDRRFGRNAVLVSRVRAQAKPERPDVAIQAVYTGPKPYLVAGGSRYPVGTIVGGRWRIAQITANQVVLELENGQRSIVEIGGAMAAR
jgi:type III secretion protein D